MKLKELLIVNSTFHNNEIIIGNKRDGKTYYNFDFPKELLDRKVLSFHVVSRKLYIRIY